MSCRSRIAMPRGVVMMCSTETKHSVPVEPVFIVTSAMREVRFASSPTRSGSRNSSSPPAHIRRGSGTGGRKPPRVGMAVGAELRHRKHRLRQAPMRGERRGVAGLGLADLLEQRRAQALHQLRGDDVGGLRGAADPLPQMIEIELFGETSVMTIWSGREELWAVRGARRWRARRHSGAARRRRSRPARHS